MNPIESNSHHDSEKVLLADEANDTQHMSPGRILQNRRIALKLTAEDIAKQLRLPALVISQLEADQYEKIASTTYIKGYLRAYATLVNIEPNIIMNQFDALGYHEAAHQLLDLEMNHKMIVEKAIRWITYGVIATLLCLIVIWLRYHNIHSRFQHAPLQQSQSSDDTPKTQSVVLDTIPLKASLYNKALEQKISETRQLTILDANSIWHFRHDKISQLWIGQDSQHNMPLRQPMGTE